MWRPPSSPGEPSTLGVPPPPAKGARAGGSKVSAVNYDKLPQVSRRPRTSAIPHSTHLSVANGSSGGTDAHARADRRMPANDTSRQAGPVGGRPAIAEAHLPRRNQGAGHRRPRRGTHRRSRRTLGEETRDTTRDSDAKSTPSAEGRAELPAEGSAPLDIRISGLLRCAPISNTSAAATRAQRRRGVPHGGADLI